MAKKQLATVTPINPAVVVPVLTRPVAVATKGTPKAEVEGHEEAVDRIVEIRRTVETLESEEALLRPPLEAAAKKARVKLESNVGKTIKSVVCKGNTQDVRFTWRNVYATVAIEHEPALQACLGPHFDTLFERSFNIKFSDRSAAGRREAVKTLRKALGDQFDAIFEVAPEIAAKDELLEKRTVLKGVLTPEQNGALDAILEQIQSKPTLVTK